MKEGLPKITDADLDRIEATARGTYVPPKKDRFDLRTESLYAAVSGLKIEKSPTEIATGLILRETFLHIMLPGIMAFSAPQNPSAPHPGPWAALNEKSVNVCTELEIAKIAGDSPLGFDRLNTVWFLVALLRLRLSFPIFAPVIADRSLHLIKDAPQTSNALPVELGSAYQFSGPKAVANEGDLNWLKAYAANAARLIRNPMFARAFMSFDGVPMLGNTGAAVVISWASIETLIRPGQARITDRVCRALATYLNPPGPERDKAFAEIRSSYLTRGGAVHDGQRPKLESDRIARRLARAALLKTIENGAMPDIEQLLNRWSSGT